MLPLLLATVVSAPPAQSGRQDGPDLGRVVLDEVERRLICEFFGTEGAPCRDGDDGTRHDGDRKGKGKGKAKGGKDSHGGGGLPPGLAKRDTLPPGLQRQLDEKGRLPPGLEKRALPTELADRLPPRRDGTEIVIVDRDVLLVQAATGLVLDAIAGIVH
jgi:hypothetical protein